MKLQAFLTLVIMATTVGGFLTYDCELCVAGGNGFVVMNPQESLQPGICLTAKEQKRNKGQFLVFGVSCNITNCATSWTGTAWTVDGLCENGEWTVTQENKESGHPVIFLMTASSILGIGEIIWSKWN